MNLACQPSEAQSLWDGPKHADSADDADDGGDADM